MERDFFFFFFFLDFSTLAKLINSLERAPHAENVNWVNSNPPNFLRGLGSQVSFIVLQFLCIQVFCDPVLSIDSRTSAL